MSNSRLATKCNIRQLILVVILIPKRAGAQAQVTLLQAPFPLLHGDILAVSVEAHRQNLSRTDSGENIRAVIFPVSPIELSGLVTLAGSVMPGTDPVQVPQGADCNSITAFAYAQAESPAPRAVLGMLGVDGRELMRKRFRDDILTLTLPLPLFQRMEEEAKDCIFQIPAWKRLAERA